MTTVIYDDEPCAARLPGLTHTIAGFRCEACGQPCASRGRDEMGVLLGAPATIPAIPATECRCWDCVHPMPSNAGERVLHARRHEEFASWLGDRPVALASLHLPGPIARLRMDIQERNAEPYDGGELA